MCGIFGVVNDSSKNAAHTVLEGLKKLEYRGYDSWGISLKKETTLLVEKHKGKIGSAKTKLPAGTTAIGHTRWATHGGVTDENAHPHLDCTSQIAVIHNGIVENYQELKQMLMKKRHIFHSETDTEVIAHLIEENRKTLSLTHAILRAFKTVVGSNAIAVLDRSTETITACRNGSPLVIGFGKKTHYIASDTPAFLKYTDKVHFLRDGECAVINIQGVSLYDIVSEKQKSFTPEIIDWKVEDAEKGGFPHFMLKEIIEQQTIIPKTAQINIPEIEKTADLLRSASHIVLSGCGTASHCALIGKYFFSKLGIDTQTYGAYEFLPFARFCGSKTVFIAISQSGETADTLIAVKQAKKQGATIVALVNARGSTLERLADIVLPVGAGPEIAVVSTKAFTAQVAVLYLLSRAVNGSLKKAQRDITSLGKTLKHWMNDTLLQSIVTLTKDLLDHEHMYVIGKHLNYPGAMEFALKIKESSYVHAESFAAGELKHGVIALIQHKTPCFILSSQDEVKFETLSSAAELKARGGYIIGVAPYRSPEFDHSIITPESKDLTLFPNIIVGQLFGYYLGIGRGTDPDKPRNLAKSVTVK